MMKNILKIMGVLILTALLTVFLVACGGGGDGTDVISPDDAGIKGEFLIVEESFLVGYPDPWTTVTKYHRAVETEDKELMLLEAPGKMLDDGNSLIIRRNWSGNGLSSITAYVMDLEFTLEASNGVVVGEWREKMYLPEARKTITLCHSGEKVKMTGYVKEDFYTGFQGVKVFAVSSIKKI